MALIGGRTGERLSHGSGVAHPHLYLERPAAHVDKEDVPAGEQPFQALRPGELAQGFVEPPFAEPQHAAGMMEEHLGPRVGSGPQRFLRAVEMALGVGEAAHPLERHAGHYERTGRHRLARPAVLLGDRERPLAQLERERQRLPRQRRRDGQVREATDLDEGP